MEHVIDRGIQVLIPPDASRRKSPRPGWDGGYYAFMRRVLASERGGELYCQRQPMIEPVFGQTKFNRGMSRFHRRGRAAVRTEWRLITATTIFSSSTDTPSEPPDKGPGNPQNGPRRQHRGDSSSPARSPAGAV
jgi:hypothetical protein